MKRSEIFNEFINGFIKGAICVIIIFSILFSIGAYYESDIYFEKKKEFVLDNIDQFELVNIQGNDLYIYKMYITDGGYYDEISFVLSPDYSYIVLWADRDKDTYWQDFCWMLIKDTTVDLKEDGLDSVLIAEMKKKRIHNGN